MKSAVNSFRRTLLAAAAVTAVFPLAWPAGAAMIEGKQYSRIPRKATPVPEGKIAVLEFFSYYCPHCADLNPILNQWEKTLPADVVLMRVPVIWGRLQGLARAYYTLELLNETKLANLAFDALQKQRIRIDDEATFIDWATQNGADRAKLTSMYHSFAVSSKVAQSEQLEKEYRVEGIPHIFVNGTIGVNLEGFNSLEGFLKGVDEAIAMARAENKKGR